MSRVSSPLDAAAFVPAPSFEARPGQGAEEAARAFEGYLAQVMLQEMRKTVPEGGLFQSNAMDLFSSLFDQEIATRIGERGGLGIRELLLEGLRRHGGGGGEAPADGLPPVEGGVFTSRFGRRRDPFHGDDRHHRGVDIGAPAGAPVRAVQDGVVQFAGQRDGYGNVVVVDHGGGRSTLYAHCQDVLARAGDSVRAGQAVATVGSTGRSTGPHLHFEVREDGRAVDPASVFPWAAGRPR